MEFPADPYTGRIALIGDHVRIGRHSKSKGITPDIDLSGDLEDTGVSHRHAVLMRQPSGSWALVDQDSTNGTFLNAEEDPLPPNQPVALSHGDQVHVGAWTTLTLERSSWWTPGTRPGQPAVEGHAQHRPWPEKGGDRPARPAPPPGQGEGRPDTARLERAVLACLALNVGTPVSVGNLEAASVGRPRARQTSNKSLQGIHRQPARASARGNHRDGPIAATASRRRGTPWTWFVSSAGVPGGGRSWRRAIPAHPWRCSRARSTCGAANRSRPLRLAGGTAVAVGLRERHACAEEDRFDGRLQLGDHEALVPDLYPAVEAQPLRQRRWAQLMLALYRCNRQKEASNEFRRLGSVLDEYGFVQSRRAGDVRGGDRVEPPRVAVDPATRGRRRATPDGGLTERAARTSGRGPVPALSHLAMCV